MVNSAARSASTDARHGSRLSKNGIEVNKIGMSPFVCMRPRTITAIVLLSHPKYVDDLTCRSSSRLREKRDSAFGGALVLAAGRPVVGIRSRLSDGAAHAGSARARNRPPDARLRMARLAGPEDQWQPPPAKAAAGLLDGGCQLRHCWSQQHIGAITDRALRMACTGRDVWNLETIVWQPGGISCVGLSA